MGGLESKRFDAPAPGSVKERFIEWMLLPESERVPATQTAFGEAHGVHRLTLGAWKKEPGFIRAMEARMIELEITPDNLMKVVEALRKEAERGDVAAAKAYIAYNESLRPKRVEIEDSDVQAMTEEEIDTELRELLANSEALNVIDA